MSQNQAGDYAIDPFTTSGQQLAAILNRLHDAGLTTHSGAARPPYAKAGTVWLDTSTAPGVLKWFDGTNDHTIVTGDGLPAGGTTGQVLAKQSATDGDVDWDDVDGGIVPDPAAGVSQTITAADPGDTPLELTPAAGQTEALLKANGKDVIDASGNIILHSDKLEIFQLGETDWLKDYAGTGMVEHNVIINNPKTDLGEGFYLLFINGRIGGYHSAALTIATRFTVHPLANTDIVEQIFSAYVNSAKVAVMSVSATIPMKITAGTQADFSTAGFFTLTQYSNYAINQVKIGVKLFAIKLADL